MAMNWNSQLPPGWEAKWDQTYNRYYFIDHSTQQTSWNDPRVAYAARRQPAPERIQMQNLSPRQHSAQSYSGQSASSSRTQETNFQMSIDPSVDDNEDEEWRNALFLSSMQNNDKKKRLMFHEKINMKEKFKREFKQLDGVLVENTVEKHDYDEDIIREMLSSLKDSNIDKERKKREEEQRKRREKEEELKRKAAERKRAMERIRKEQREKKEAEKRKAEMEAKKRASAQAATTAAKPRPSAATVTVQARPISAPRVTTPKYSPQITQPAKPKTVPAKASPAPKPSADKGVYISSNRLQPLGPQASLRQGPDMRNLIRGYVNATGPNRSLVSGPQRANRKGPSAIQAKMSISKGPQTSLRQGPQCRLVHGQARSNVTGQPSPISAV